MKRDFYVYVWTNKVNGKQYVGKGHGNRATWHTPGRKSLVSKAMSKYGREQFSLVYLFQDLSESEAYAVEARLVAQRGCLVPNGYNLAAGGRGGSAGVSRPWTHEQVAKSRALWADPEKRAEHSKKLLSAQTPEVRARKSRAAKAAQTPEGRAKTVAAHTGAKRSEEAKRRMSEAAKARCTPEWKAKHAARMRKQARENPELFNTLAAKMRAAKGY